MGPKMVDSIRRSNLARTQNTIIDAKLPELELDSISYSVMTKEKMEKVSVMEVLDAKNKGISENTVDDFRLGTIETHKQCTTCKKTNDECPGHYAIINLNDKIFHPLFRDTSIKVLQSICWKCLKPLLGKPELEDIELKGMQRLSFIAKKSKKIKHFSCNKITDYGYNQNPVFKTGTAAAAPCISTTCATGRAPGSVSMASASNKDSICICATVVDNEQNKVDFNIHPTLAEKIFIGLTSETIKLLGFEGYVNSSDGDNEWVWRNHPKNFIINFIPVIPLSARPYRIREGNKQDDFITKFYEDVIAQKHRGEDQHALAMILWFYNHIIDNSDKAYKKTSTEVIKSFKERLVGETRTDTWVIDGQTVRLYSQNCSRSKWYYGVWRNSAPGSNAICPYDT